LGGLGFGDGGLGMGIGDWAQSPIPNPQSPIPNPQIKQNKMIKIIIYKIDNFNIYLLFNFLIFHF